MKSRTFLITMAIIFTGMAAGLIIHNMEPAVGDAEGEQSHEEETAAKGPHGGRIFTEQNFSLEVTIFEQSVAPEFRVYTYEQDNPLDPAGIKLHIQLERLGAEPEIINFQKEKDFLRGGREIIEPHSFTVNINAERDGKTYRWSYTQEEG